ncbi:hypothetical protein TWF694_011868 [Orbilia ellipsospora]|uniref:Sfi1 spindle body domain-containing protein n=1 Tax=Orbilia ellipsospora TaxID=2528407 RepID=A0AAV9X9F6_9PEZI
MPLDRQNHIFGVRKPLPTRVDLTRQEIDLLREIVTYASVIPETTPWNALFHAYDAILRKKGIDAALDDRCFRFLMRLAEVQGTSWYDRYATLLSMWQYEVPPKTAPSPIKNPISFSTSQISANIGPITITFKTNRRPIGPDGAMVKPLPNPRITLLDDEDAITPKMITAGKENIRVNNGLSSPHPSMLHRRKLPPTDEEKRQRERLEQMKAEFAFPTSLLETASEVGLRQPDEMETPLTRASFLNEEDFEDQNDETNSPEQTAYIPPIRDKAGLIAAAEKAVVRYNTKQIAFAGDIIKHWRAHAYRAAEYHQLQWDLACSKDQRVLASQVFDVWRVGVYWSTLERRVALQRRLIILTNCVEIWRTKAVLKSQRKEIINRNMLMRKFFRAWKAQSEKMKDKIRIFKLTVQFKKWKQRFALNRGSAEIARQRYCRDLKYRAYWTLFYGYCNIRAPQLNEHRLKRFAIQILRDRIAATLESERVASELYYFSLLKKIFRMWYGDLVWTREIAAKADEERRYQLLYKGVLSWRREARFAPLVRQQQDTHDVNQATALLALWKNRLRQIRAADHVNKINVLKTLFRSWRLRLRTKQHEKYVKSVYLSTWFDRYSGALADRCYQYHVWKQRLHEWREKLRCMRDVEVAAEDFASTSVYAKLKLGVLELFRARLVQVRDLEDKANTFRKRKLLAIAMSGLALKQNQLVQMRAWSNSAAYFLGAKKIWKIWIQALEKRKRQHRKESYNQVVRNRALRLKTLAFNTLLTRHDAISSLEVTAEDFFESGCRVQATNLVMLWREKLRHARGLQSFATEFRSNQLVAMAMSALEQRLYSIRDLYHLSETYNEISRKDKAANILKRLKIAHFHHKLESVKADMFRQRADVNRQKAIFRAWYWGYRERYERRQVDDQWNREFVLDKERQHEDSQQLKLTKDQLERESHLHAERRSRTRSEVGDVSILGPEGLSMLDVGEWINSNSASIPLSSTNTSRIPQTPSARAARARAILEGRNTISTTRLKLNSTTPTASPSQRFSRSIRPFSRSITSRPDLRFTQSLSSKLRREIKEVDEDEDRSSVFLKGIDWDENEQLPNIDETEDENRKMSGSTTAVATQESPGR